MKNSKWRKQIGLIGLALALAVGCFADEKPPKDVISLKKARQIAMKAEAGKVSKSELEFENGLWIYSFDILGKDQKNHEVNVDAHNGKVVDQSVENATDEAKEAAEDTKAGFKVLKQAALPGDGGWDFLSVEGASRRLYVTHADSVQVLNADTLELVGTVAGIPRPHGVLALPELGRGYVTSGDPGSVVVFDLKTFAKLGEVPSSKDTDVILYEPVSGHIFTFNGDSSNATIIDPASMKTLGTIDLGGAPEVAVADGKGTLYDNLADKNQVIKIDAKTQKVLARWDTAPGTSPTGLALDAEHGRLFVGCRNQLLVVMDVATGKVVQTLPIGEHVDSTGFDPKTETVFNSCGDGTLSVIHEDGPDKYAVVENAKTEQGARTLAVDSLTGHVFADTAKFEAKPEGDKEKEKKRPKPIPGSFHVLMLGH